jgi:ATP phosphoribosyltransferase
MEVKFEINLGLGNNPYSYQEVVNLLHKHLRISGTRLEVSEYDGETELTVVASGIGNADYVVPVLRSLATITEQECIAVMFESSERTGRLVYNRSFIGDKMDFDPKYFIRWDSVMTEQPMMQEVSINATLGFDVRISAEQLQQLISDAIKSITASIDVVEVKVTEEKDIYNLEG